MDELEVKMMSEVADGNLAAFRKVVELYQKPKNNHGTKLFFIRYSYYEQ